MATVIRRKYLGIELGAETATAVLIQAQRGEDRLLAWNRVAVDPSVAPAERLTALLEPLLAEDGIAGATSILALSADNFLFRPLHAPFDDDRKLRQVLPFELEPTLSLPTESVVFDYQRLEDGRRPLILAAAIEQERLGQVLADLGALRVDPEVVTVAGLGAALHIARQPQAPEQMVVADLRADGACLFLFAGGRLRNLRDLCLDATDPDGRRLLIDRLEQTFRAVSVPTAEAFAPREIALIGYGPETAAMEAAMADRLQVPVRRVELETELGLGTGEATVTAWEPGRFNGALGLALAGRLPGHGFNLRQGPFAVKRFWTRYSRQIRRTAVLALIVLLLGGIQVAGAMYRMAKESARLESEIESVFRQTFPEATRIVDPLHQAQTRIEALRASIRLPGTDAARPRAIDILNALSTDIPDAIDVEFTKLVLGPDNLVITGHTSTFNAVDEIKTGLESDRMFREVTISSANIDKQTGRVRFTVNIGRLEAR